MKGQLALHVRWVYWFL